MKQPAFYTQNVTESCCGAAKMALSSNETGQIRVVRCAEFDPESYRLLSSPNVDRIAFGACLARRLGGEIVLEIANS